MPDALQPNQVVAVSLEAQQWNVVVGQLMEGPYKTMAPLIGSIIAQCAQAQQAQQQEADIANKAAAAGLQAGPRLVVAEGPPPGYVNPLNAQMQVQRDGQTTEGSAAHGDNGEAETSPAAE